MPDSRKVPPSRATHQATTIYLPISLHRWARAHALKLSIDEDKRITQSEIIARALAEYRVRVELDDAGDPDLTAVLDKIKGKIEQRREGK